MSGYTWTKTKPTTRGFYWRRCNFDGHLTSAVVVHVFHRNGELWGENPFIACSFTKELSHKVWEHDEWAGPIQEPATRSANHRQKKVKARK